MSAPSVDLTEADKNVVERASLRRNSPSRQALRSARERLHSREADLQFLPEMLALHASTQKAHRHLAFATVALIGGITLLASVLVAPSFEHVDRMALGRSAAAMVILFFAYACNIRVCSKDRSDPDQQGRERRRRMVLCCQFGIGLAWASVILALPVLGTVEGRTGIAVLSVAAAQIPLVLQLLLALNIRAAFLCVAFPIVLALVMRAAWMQTPHEALAAGTVLLTVFVLSHLAHRLNDGVVQALQAGIEKDNAVLEAEETRMLSEEARRRAEEANLAKTRFLATMSHELRTPLNAILGFSEIMHQQVLGPLDETYRGYADDIHSSGSHLLKLINEILDLSRVEAGKYDLNEEAVSLLEIASEARQMMRVKAEQKNITLHLNGETALPRVWIDERAMRQVILNLLSNAVKFTHQGGHITLAVGWTAGGGQYVVVRDNGPGIADEEIPIVMGAFGQGTIALRAAEPGTGLGLPIVKAFVEMHDGKFHLRSKLREGTECIVILPRRRVMGDEVVGGEARQPRAFAA